MLVSARRGSRCCEVVIAEGQFLVDAERDERLLAWQRVGRLAFSSHPCMNRQFAISLQIPDN